MRMRRVTDKKLRKVERKLRQAFPKRCERFGDAWVKSVVDAKIQQEQELRRRCAMLPGIPLLPVPIIPASPDA